MKRNVLVASLGALALGALFSVSASAGTCAAPTSWQPPSAGGEISGTTCGGDATAPSYCGGNFDAPGPAYVIQSNFTAAGSANRNFSSITVGGGGAGFDVAVYMTPVAAGCGTDAACGATGDALSPITSPFVAAGNWFIIVTAGSTNNPGSCGAFTLTSDGSLPVSLQNFDII